MKSKQIRRIARGGALLAATYVLTYCILSSLGRYTPPAYGLTTADGVTVMQRKGNSRQAWMPKATFSKERQDYSILGYIFEPLINLDRRYVHIYLYE